MVKLEKQRKTNPSSNDNNVRPGWRTHYNNSIELVIIPTRTFAEEGSEDCGSGLWNPPLVK
jgi:hypothetical protein